MPRISVVVPIYNVEAYLEPCLESIARQTFGDLEVLMVNDGSKDSSRDIAQAFAERDPRFRLIDRPNGGLSAARNTGMDAAEGEFLSFVDSDDVLPDNAFELHLAALDRSGSDFSTGNVLRLMATGTRRAKFVAGVFGEERLGTHITKFPRLLADRTAWNKVWRRSFWEEHGFRFPEGRVNEDIPVVLPAHFSARAVDVIPEPVYLWRIRDTGGLSITERRLEHRALLDRIAAVSDVSHYLAEHGPVKAKRWYDETLVAEDLRYYLNVLPYADDEYRTLFLDRVNALLDDADDGIYDPLPPVERLKWALVRRRRLPELLEVLRFQREELAERPPQREGGKWYADLPYRGDPDLALPDSTFRYEDQFRAVAQVDGLRREDGRVVIDGWIFIEGIAADEPGAQRVTVSLLRPGRLARVRHRLSAIRLPVEQVERKDANDEAVYRGASWAGFSTTLEPERLRRLGRWREGQWELFVTVEAGGIRRRTNRFAIGGSIPPRAVDLPGPAELVVRAAPTPERGVVAEVLGRWAKLQSYRVADGSLELSGELHPPLPASAKPKLELRAEEGGGRRRVAVALEDDGRRFRARLALAELDVAASPTPARRGEEEVVTWELGLTGGGGRRSVVPGPELEGAGGWDARSEFALGRNQRGNAVLALRPARPLLTDARWTADGALEIAGALPALEGPHELALVLRRTLEQHAFPLRQDAPDRFEGRLTPAAVETLAGSLPLKEGRWELCVRPVGRRDEAALFGVLLDEGLAAQLPVETVVAHKPFELGATDEDVAMVISRRDLPPGERGRFHQQQLRDTVYVGGLGEPLRDAVVYSSFYGRQYSDSPRAIHEELVRRGAGLEHLWIVRDGQCRVPETATVLRAGTREHLEALSRSRFLVFNDHFPQWLTRRPDQTCLQTWHGTPLKRLGFDVSALRGTGRRFDEEWVRQIANWQYVVSPNRFSTPILRDAFRVEGEMLETGYPRVDVLARADRDAAGRALRERLGIPDGVRTVLYAPTYRDNLRDKRRRYRLDFQLDPDRLRDALGSDTVILVRKHHYVIDAVPETPDGFVRDVSTYPDATELLLAADVLVTDYSSMMVDFANTGRPMLFFAYDLETYEDEVRGFYVDYEETIPGPLLRTTDEVVEALRDLDAVQSRHASRYAAFVERFCGLDDGYAAARVVDRVFGPAAGS